MPVTTRSQTKKMVEQPKTDSFEPMFNAVCSRHFSKSVTKVEPKSKHIGPIAENIKLTKLTNIKNETLFHWFKTTLKGLFEIANLIDDEREVCLRNGLKEEAKKLIYDKICLLTQIMYIVEQNFSRVYHLHNKMNKLCITIYEKTHELYNEIHNVDEDKKPTTMKEQNIINTFTSKLHDAEKILVKFLPSDYPVK